MRRSKPGERNLKSKRRSGIQMDKKQPAKGAYDPDYEMQYGCSRKTGRRAGGYFWNPPDYCESPRIDISDNGDRWVMINFCKRCVRWKTNTCPAKTTTTKIHEPGYVIDKPKKGRTT
jgi:hypothetical protein